VGKYGPGRVLIAGTENADRSLLRLNARRIGMRNLGYGIRRPGVWSMRRHFLWIITFMFLASFNNGIAGTSCKDYYYATECKADSACTWESGKKNKSTCKKKEAATGCASHKSEFYCEANHCKWDSLSKGNKCTESTEQH
jgi:hypothetical protein